MSLLFVLYHLMLILTWAHVWDLKTTASERLHVRLAHISEITHFAKESLETLRSNYH